MQRTVLHIGCDFGGDLLTARRLYDRGHLDALMGILASLGAKRVEWIYHCWYRFAGDYPGGFDLEAEAVQAAHRHGLEFVAVIKPFEVTHDILPHAFPHPAGAPCWNSRRGIFHQLSDIALRRRDLCFRRLVGDGVDGGGPIAAIRLVKNTAAASGLLAGDLSVWTGRENGQWRRWEQPFQLRDSVEWRNLFPKPGLCRVLTLEGLSIPAGERYVEVRCARRDPAGDFVNDQESIIELVGADGQALPATPPVIFSLHGRWRTWASHPIFNDLSRYLSLPEVRRGLPDEATMDRLLEEMRDYSHRGYASIPYCFDGVGRASAARGVDEEIPLPHPIYGEVRAYWVAVAGRFLDLGADGIDFRHCMHLRWHDLHAYGFNPPVLEATGGSTNTAEVARASGDAYTRLLREAADLTHSRGKLFSVHVSSDFLLRPDEDRLPCLPANLEFQWQRWAREFADFLVFRGAMGNRPETVRAMIDRFGLTAREAGIPLIYQSNRRYLTSGRYDYHDWELSWVRRHRDVAAYQLYETAAFTKLCEDDQVTCKPGIADLLRKHGWGGE